MHLPKMDLGLWDDTDRLISKLRHLATPRVQGDFVQENAFLRENPTRVPSLGIRFPRPSLLSRRTTSFLGTVINIRRLLSMYYERYAVYLWNGWVIANT